MAFTIVTISHVVAVLFSIVELGLTSYACSVLYARYGPYAGVNVPGPYVGYAAPRVTPDQLNFMVFNSVWSLLVLAYLGLSPLFFPRLFHRLVALFLLAATTIFWFAGAIALAVFIGGPLSCGRDTFCGSLSAAVAFGFFLWAIFTGLLVLEVIEWNRTRRSATHADQHEPHAKTQPYTNA